MKILFSPASLDDLIRLLKAWRFWALAALAGALLAAAVYFAAPPPYRARATALVDFNLEEAWPQDTDRQQFYYLERESRKLEEIAWSDEVLQAVVQADGRTNVAELRDRKLQLSQPAEGGWRFYADDADAARAQSLASAWAQTFVDRSQAAVGAVDGLNSFIEVTLTQSGDLPVVRSRPIGTYLLAGTMIAWFLGALAFLFFDFSPSRPAPKRKPRKSAK